MRQDAQLESIKAILEGIALKKQRDNTGKIFY